jgi:hypothetical protein
MADAPESKVAGVVVADLERSAIGTRSRLGESFAGRPTLRRLLDRLLAVRGVGEVVILMPLEQIEQGWQLVGPENRVRIMPLERRPAALDARVRRGRAWNLAAWRGGAGQWTVFDEEYHPAAMAQACAAAFDGKGAAHLLVVPSHAVFLDTEITAALVHHHLHKNHEMRVTYTPAAPGLSGMVLRADIVREMGEKGVMPGQLLAYDPKAPAFDTLIREACMQVDPALSKIPNRFCVDTQRSWRACEKLAGDSGDDRFASAAELALAAARVVAPGVRDVGKAFDWPRELEIELTGERLTTPPGSVPANLRMARGKLRPSRWVAWLEQQAMCDDLLVTFAGDGDPLLFDGLPEVLRACRKGGALAICVQTDLASESIEPLLSAVGDGLVDVLSITMYGHTAATYEQVAGAAVHGRVMRNMEKLAAFLQPVVGAGKAPLVIPRLLKVRQTIPEMEPFFDQWIERCGWAVIDYPTDRAGGLPFAGVVDMAPPKRRPCRRIWERVVLQADGTATACDQDIGTGKEARPHLAVGSIDTMGIEAMWHALNPLRAAHGRGEWNAIIPCATCREWHRA